MIKIRKAVTSDIDEIKSLVDHYAERKFLLQVPREKIAEKIRDYLVAIDDKNKIMGCVALRIYSENLAEVRTLAVKEKYQKMGIGKKLVNKCILEAKQLGIRRIFGLTKTVDFFNKMDFTKVDMGMLPEKVYKDCLACSNFHNCDEIAVMKKL